MVSKNGQFPGFGSEEGALDPHEISHIHEFKYSEIFLTHPILADVSLDSPCSVFDMNETGLPEITEGHDPARQGEGFSRFLEAFMVHLPESLDHLGNGQVTPVTGGIKGDAHLFQRIHFFLSFFKKRAWFFHKSLDSITASSPERESGYYSVVYMS